ncbi:MAG: hypothetical protein PVS3B2_14700 [Candidatus Dormibacteraceae bacterium]
MLKGGVKVATPHDQAVGTFRLAVGAAPDRQVEVAHHEDRHLVARSGGPLQIRDLGGRSQEDDEHARERIPYMRDRACAGGDAGFGAPRGPRGIEDFAGWDGTRPRRASKMRGPPGAGH